MEAVVVITKTRMSLFHCVREDRDGFFKISSQNVLPISNVELLETMMKWATLLFLSLPYFVCAQTIFDDPTSYFDGTSSTYLDWHAEYGGFYTRSAWFPSVTGNTTGLAVHWAMDNENLYLAVAASDAQGWVSLGFSENGGMEGSDIVAFQTATPDQILDGYIKNEKQPLWDTCQNWVLIRSVVDSDEGVVLFEAQRLLTSADKQHDRSLVDDSDPTSLATLVIGAWGDEATVQYHGPNNRVRGQLRFFQSSLESVGPSFEERMAEIADGFFEHRADNHAILTKETEYKAFCISRDELVAQGVNMTAEKLYIVGFEPIVDPRSKAHVHHFVTTSSSVAQASEECERDSTAYLYGWAPGEVPLTLPNDVGIPFGDWEDAVSVQMVIHYDNPQGIAGVKDSSGVRYYYSYKPMKYEMGFLSYGDSLVRMNGEAVLERDSALVSHTFECPSTCSDTALADSPVTVFRQYVHMHRKGTAAQLQISNKKKEVVHSSTVEYFRFEQQGRQAIQQQSFEIQPGSAFQLSCEFQKNRGEDLKWGQASSEEMCMAQIMYYPRKKLQVGFGNRTRTIPWICPYGVPIPGCSSSHTMTVRSVEEELGRTFGKPVSRENMEDTAMCPSLLTVGDVDTAAVSSAASRFIVASASIGFVALLLR